MANPDRMIRRHRIRAGLTMAALAKRVRVDKSAISRYESGEQSPSLGTALRLAKVLRVPVEKLFGDRRA
jgi:transcriptional regulator with XRE-family HTH domain